MRRLTDNKPEVKRPSSFSGFKPSQRRGRRVSAGTWFITVGMMLIGTWMRNDAEEGSDAKRLPASWNPEPTPAQILSILKQTHTEERQEKTNRLQSRQRQKARTLDQPRVELDFRHLLGAELTTTTGPITGHPHHGKLLSKEEVNPSHRANKLKRTGISSSQNIHIRKEGRRRLIDARIPLSQLRPGTPSNRLIHLQGELRIEEHGTQERIYFEPSLIDGMAPPAYLREKIRQTDISHLIGDIDF